jgi:hypothetical protein
MVQGDHIGHHADKQKPPFHQHSPTGNQTQNSFFKWKAVGLGCISLLILYIK